MFEQKKRAGLALITPLFLFLFLFSTSSFADYRVTKVKGNRVLMSYEDESPSKGDRLRLIDDEGRTIDVKILKSSKKKNRVLARVFEGRAKRGASYSVDEGDSGFSMGDSGSGSSPYFLDVNGGLGLGSISSSVNVTKVPTFGGATFTETVEVSESTLSFGGLVEGGMRFGSFELGGGLGYSIINSGSSSNGFLQIFGLGRYFLNSKFALQARLMPYASFTDEGAGSVTGFGLSGGGRFQITPTIAVHGDLYYTSFSNSSADVSLIQGVVSGSYRFF